MSEFFTNWLAQEPTITLTAAGGRITCITSLGGVESKRFEQAVSPRPSSTEAALQEFEGVAQKMLKLAVGDLVRRCDADEDLSE